VVSMNDALRHRGPDDEGFYVDRNVCLGMTRLSIIDLARGHQPIGNENKTIWVVCNGEIYNHKFLRAGLEAKGHRFSTNCDVEVIVHQYEEDGERCFAKLNGMFGLAIWDKNERKLLIARDRLGIKPLYYYLDGEKLLFSSEPKAILRDRAIVPEVDNQALWDYLTFRYVPAPRSMFKGILKMAPGYFGVLDNAKFSLKEFWDIETRGIDVGGEGNGGEDYAKLFEDQFYKSVESHLMSDVPLGVLLSGGLDSSAVVYAMRRLGVSRVETFSVGFDAGPEFNELLYARRVAEQFETEHHEILIGVKDFVNCLDRYIYHVDEPLADLACIPLWYVSKLARERVKVVLSGEGSDELLAGYPGMEQTALKSKVLKTYQSLPSILRGPFGLYFKSPFVSSRFGKKLEKLSIPLGDLGIHYPKNMTNYFSEAEKESLLGMPRSSFSESYGAIKDLYEMQRGKNPLDQVLYVYSKYWLADNLLTKADRMTMGNSLELRVPFLDHDMVEMAFRLPDKMKVEFSLGFFGARRKAVLRRIMESHLPREILERRKYGFPTPENRWLEGELNGFVKDALYSESSFIANNCNRSDVDALFRQSDMKIEMARSKIWILFVFEIWNRIFIRGECADESKCLKYA
jgi:asparagine synthase (glutamine-hydrolysing)